MPVLSTLSTKGGSQKTTTTLCLGLALAAKGYNTILIDMDLSNASLSSWKKGRDALSKSFPENFTIITAEEMSEALKKTEFLDFLEALQEQLDPADFVLIDLEGTANEYMTDAIVSSHLLLAPTAISNLDAQGIKRTFAQVRRQRKITGRDIAFRVVPTKTPKLLATMSNEDRRMMSDILYELEAEGIEAFDSALADRAGYRHLFNNKHWYLPQELPEKGIENKDLLWEECNNLAEDVLDALLDEQVAIDPNRVTLGSVIRKFRDKQSEAVA